MIEHKDIDVHFPTYGDYPIEEMKRDLNTLRDLLNAQLELHANAIRTLDNRVRELELFIPERFIAPGGTGIGSSWEDAAAPDNFVNFARNPKTAIINFRADFGDEYAGNFEVASALYRDEQPLLIRGKKSDGTPGLAKIVSDRTPWVRPMNPEEVTITTGWVPGGNGFNIQAGASHLTFENFDFQRVGICFNFAGNMDQLIIRECNGYNIRRFLEHPTLTDLVDVLIHDVDVVGHSKHAIRCRGNSHDWYVHHVIIDSARQSHDNFAVGLGINDSAYDILVEDSSFLNCHDALNNYWNGDGVSSEEQNHDLIFRRVTCNGHTDGGMDLKSYNNTIEDCVFLDNKHGIRVWNHDITLTGCTLGPAHIRGGGGKPSLVGTYTNEEADVTVNLVDCQLIEDGTGALIEHGLGLGKTSILNVVTSTYDFHYLTRMRFLSNGSIDTETDEIFDVAPVLPLAPWLNPNPQGTGAVDGSPGTQPTGWEFEGNQNGLVRTITVGPDYVDLRYAGTTTNTARIDTHFNAPGDTLAVVLDRREAVIDMEIIGVIPALTGILLRLIELDSGNVSVGSGTEVQVFSNARTVYDYKRELSAPTVASVRNRLEFTYPNATAIDITFRIYEAGIREWAE